MGLSLAKTSPHLARVNLNLGCQPLVGYEEEDPTGPFEGRPYQVDSFLANTVPRGICGNVKRQLDPAHFPAQRRDPGRSSDWAYGLECSTPTLSDPPNSCKV